WLLARLGLDLDGGLHPDGGVVRLVLVGDALAVDVDAEQVVVLAPGVVGVHGDVVGGLGEAEGRGLGRDRAVGARRRAGGPAPAGARRARARRAAGGRRGRRAGHRGI